nr:AAA family ATPase [Pseudarcicella sp.]
MNNYFQNLADLLAKEKETDKAQYLEICQKASISEKKASGMTWYPVAIRGSELGMGDYLTVEFERTTQQDTPHQFRFGMPVEFFSNHNAAEDKINGTVTHQSGNKIKINILTDELPDWSKDGKLGLNVLFDDNSYDEMNDALKKGADLLEKENDLKIAILTGAKKSNTDNNETFFLSEKFNVSQKKAITKILNANELAIVHGPPGTGKTTTIVEAIKQLVSLKKEQILVVAPSNTAVDLLSEKLHNQGLNVIRIGNPAKVNDQTMQLTLDYQIAHHESNKTIKKLKKQAQEYKQMAHKYKRNFGKAERDQRKLLFEEAHKIMKEVGNTETYITEKIFENTQVITATLVGANNYTIKN